MFRLLRVMCMMGLIVSGEGCNKYCSCTLERTICFFKNCDGIIPLEETYVLQIHGRVCLSQRQTLRNPPFGNTIIELMDAPCYSIPNCRNPASFSTTGKEITETTSTVTTASTSPSIFTNDMEGKDDEAGGDVGFDDNDDDDNGADAPLAPPHQPEDREDYRDVQDENSDYYYEEEEEQLTTPETTTPETSEDFNVDSIPTTHTPAWMSTIRSYFERYVRTPVLGMLFILLLVLIISMYIFLRKCRKWCRRRKLCKKNNGSNSTDTRNDRDMYINLDVALGYDSENHRLFLRKNNVRNAQSSLSLISQSSDESMLVFEAGATNRIDNVGSSSVSSSKRNSAKSK